MKTISECRQRAKAAGEARAWLAAQRGRAALHPIPTQVGPRSPLRFPDGRTKHMAIGRPIDNARLGANNIGAAMQATKAGKAEAGSRQALTALAHATRVATLGELAASIAHEINQPLAAIVLNGEACMQWLDRDMPDLAKVRIAAKRMISDASRAAEIVRRLGALSRKADPDYRPLSINDLVTETIPLLRREIASHGAALHLDLHSDVPPVAGDKIQLQQVVINFVVNGIQAMAGVVGRQSSLTIRSRRHRGNGALVSVIDNGTGIDPSHLDTLFDAFFTTKPAGMGMGLSICRSIIEAHGGEVGASNNRDFGATFHFALPGLSEGCDRERQGAN
jgi:C4-dicarboxylate-specific signal transduction histidine kinase